MAARTKKKKKKTRSPAGRKRPAARKPVARKPAARKATARRPVARRRAPVENSLAREKARLEKNKQLVLAFYAKMIGEKDPEAARRFMGEPYVQHSPYAKDGFEGVAEFARTFKRDFPRHTYDVKRVLAEGDFVMLHLHGKQGLSPHGEAVIDLFRVRNGKVVEHWDVIQPLPECSENPNGPF